MSYNVTFSPSGHRFPCSDTQEILKAAAAAGFAVPYSCRSGVCNTCRARVVEGEVDWGDVHPTYLNDDDKAKGLVLLCQARPKSDLIVEVSELAPDAVPPARFMPARVLEMQRAADDVMVVTLGLPMNEPTAFRAGQYIDILRADGTRRSYSVSTVPETEGVRRLHLHVRHLPGGKFSDHVFGSMLPREMHKIEFPLGSFFLREDSQAPIIMLAAGTGFSPVKSMIGDMLRRGIERPTAIYWGGRRREDIYMADLCEAWARDYPHITYVPVLSDPSEHCKWTGRIGYVHHAVMQDFADLSGHEIYACGSPAMVEAARRDLTAERSARRELFFADSFLTAKERAFAHERTSHAS